MLHFSRWKVIAILASVVLSILFALPNILPPAWQKAVGEYTIARPMTLGLDLQGGSNVLLEVDRKDFNLNWNAPLEAGGFLVGDDVKIQLDVEAVRQV